MVIRFTLFIILTAFSQSVDFKETLFSFSLLLVDISLHLLVDLVHILITTIFKVLDHHPHILSPVLIFDVLFSSENLLAILLLSIYIVKFTVFSVKINDD